LVDDLDRLESQRKASKARIRTAVAASGTTLTDIFGVGDVVAATLIGHTGDIGRFPTADRFAAYNGTAPIEWSSGNPKRPTHRLSRRGNRAMNHALHIVAVTQLRHSHSPGRAFYDRKLGEGHTPKEAIRALKRRLSTVVYRHLVVDAARRAIERAREGISGNDSTSLRDRPNVLIQPALRQQPLPNPPSTLRPRPPTVDGLIHRALERFDKSLTNKECRSGWASVPE
jgi:Transposase IS116/IS110/IS902 family